MTRHHCSYSDVTCRRSQTWFRLTIGSLYFKIVWS